MHKRFALKTIALAALALAALGIAAPAAAQQWKPSRPINLIVPWAAGGSTDQVTRVAAAEMEKALGQTIVVVNQPGASGAIGTKSALDAPKDGYTWTAGGPGHDEVDRARGFPLLGGGRRGQARGQCGQGQGLEGKTLVHGVCLRLIPQTVNCDFRSETLVLSTRDALVSRRASAAGAAPRSRRPPGAGSRPARG